MALFKPTDDGMLQISKNCQNDILQILSMQTMIYVWYHDMTSFYGIFVFIDLFRVLIE